MKFREVNLPAGLAFHCNHSLLQKSYSVHCQKMTSCAPYYITLNSSYFLWEHSVSTQAFIIYTIIHFLHEKLPNWSCLHLRNTPLHYAGCHVYLKQMAELWKDPHLGHSDRFQAGLSSSCEVAHHLCSVRSAAQVGVDPVSACQRAAEEETT